MAAGIDSLPEMNASIAAASACRQKVQESSNLPHPVRRLIERLACAQRALRWDELLPALAEEELLEIDAHALARQAAGRDGVLYTDEHFEILCLSWPTGETSSVHDHRGSRCCFRVLQGVLRNTDFVCDQAAPRPIRSFDVPRGVLLLKEDRETHQVTNPQPQAAVSLHIYSPPLPK